MLRRAWTYTGNRLSATRALPPPWQVRPHKPLVKSTAEVCCHTIRLSPGPHSFKPPAPPSASRRKFSPPCLVPLAFVCLPACLPAFVRPRAAWTSSHCVLLAFESFAIAALPGLARLFDCLEQFIFYFLFLLYFINSPVTGPACSVPCPLD